MTMTSHVDLRSAVDGTTIQNIMGAFAANLNDNSQFQWLTPLINEFNQGASQNVELVVQRTIAQLMYNVPLADAVRSAVLATMADAYQNSPQSMGDVYQLAVTERGKCTAHMTNAQNEILRQSQPPAAAAVYNAPIQPAVARFNDVAVHTPQPAVATTQTNAFGTNNLHAAHTPQQPTTVQPMIDNSTHASKVSNHGKTEIPELFDFDEPSKPAPVQTETAVFHPAVPVAQDEPDDEVFFPGEDVSPVVQTVAEAPEGTAQRFLEENSPSVKRASEAMTSVAPRGYHYEVDEDGSYISVKHGSELHDLNSHIVKGVQGNSIGSINGNRAQGAFHVEDIENRLKYDGGPAQENEWFDLSNYLERDLADRTGNKMVDYPLALAMTENETVINQFRRIQRWKALNHVTSDNHVELTVGYSCNAIAVTDESDYISILSVVAKFYNSHKSLRNLAEVFEPTAWENITPGEYRMLNMLNRMACSVINATLAFLGDSQLQIDVLTPDTYRACNASLMLVSDNDPEVLDMFKEAVAKRLYRMFDHVARECGDRCGGRRVNIAPFIVSDNSEALTLEYLERKLTVSLSDTHSEIPIVKSDVVGDNKGSEITKTTAHEYSINVTTGESEAVAGILPHELKFMRRIAMISSETATFSDLGISLPSDGTPVLINKDAFSQKVGDVLDGDEMGAFAALSKAARDIIRLRDSTNSFAGYLITADEYVIEVDRASYSADVLSVRLESRPM